jgi:hypothetical protein
MTPTHPRGRLPLAALCLIALLGCEEGQRSGDAGPVDGTPDAAVADSGQPDRSPVDGPAPASDLDTTPDSSTPDIGTPVLDPTTLSKKVMFGYQGWFSCPGVGSPVDAWMHWFKSQTPTAANASVEMLPDVSELGANERCPTQMTLASGKTVDLYSAHNPATVSRHFEWMKTNNLDGVFLQRFTSELTSPPHLALRDQVAKNVRAGAEAHDRVFAMMYDISGQDPSTLITVLQQDWAHLVDTLQITASPRYLRHKGLPVLAIWGLGFTDRPGTPAQAQQIIDHFQQNAPAKYRVTLMGGVPTHWRTLSNDAKSDPAWAQVYLAFDVLSPWSVGRYADQAGADSFKSKQIAADLAALQGTGVEYLPVVWPGFSWSNLFPGSPFNQIPRVGGAFLWRQVYNAIDAGASMLYVAMFDEVDEGTAMFKVAATQAELPAQGSFLPLDADGTTLPSDWYLRVADQAGRMLRGQIPLTPTLPISP